MTASSRPTITASCAPARASPCGATVPSIRRRANIERSEWAIKAAELSAAQQKIEVVRAASFRYWDWVAAGRRLVIARDLLRLAMDRDEALAARAAKGDIPEIERTENARAILQRQTQVVSAERAVQQAAIELSLFFRDGRGEPIVVPGDEQVPEIPEPYGAEPTRAIDERVAVQRRPEVARLEAVRAQLGVERRWADNQTRPAVDLLMVASRDLGPGDLQRARPVLEVALMIEIPLATRTATGRMQAAEAGIERTDAQLRLARDRAVAEVRDAASALAASRARAGMARRELEVARLLATQEMRRFEAGEGTLLLVNLREQAAAEAALRNIDALAEWHKALAARRAALSEI